MTTKITFDPNPRSVNEGSHLSFTARFYDADGTAAAPTSVRYKVEDIETEENMVSWTTASAATAVSFTIPASANVIEDESNRRERRLLTVEANQGTDTAYSASTYYDVINVLGI